MADFSCFVNIVNKTSSAMNLVGVPAATEGKYISNPPASIAAGATIVFQIQQQDALSAGSVGKCAYSVTDAHGVNGSIMFLYSCPAIIIDTNTADAIKTGAAAIKIQMIPNPLPQYGHPVNVQFTISNA